MDTGQTIFNIIWEADYDYYSGPGSGGDLEGSGMDIPEGADEYEFYSNSVQDPDGVNYSNAFSRIFVSNQKVHEYDGYLDFRDSDGILNGLNYYDFNEYLANNAADLVFETEYTDSKGFRTIVRDVLDNTVVSRENN